MFTVDDILKEAKEAIEKEAHELLLKELLPDKATIVEPQTPVIDKEAGVVDFLKRDIRSFARIRPGGRGLARALTKEQAETYQGLIRAKVPTAKLYMEAARSEGGALEHLQHALKGVSDPEGRAQVVRGFHASSRIRNKAIQEGKEAFERSLSPERPPKPMSFFEKNKEDIKSFALPAAAAIGSVTLLSAMKKKKEPENAA